MKLEIIKSTADKVYLVLNGSGEVIGSFSYNFADSFPYELGEFIKKYFVGDQDEA
jgi:hypothetical protein